MGNILTGSLCAQVEVDYRGNDVTARNFLNVLAGRHAPGVTASQRLQSDGGSDVLVYMTGHGGDEFLKFRDFEELTAVDLAIAVSEAHVGQRYNRMLIMADTCEAHSLSSYLTPEDTPEVAFVSSSLVTENSYSLDSDKQLGVLISDRWTHWLDGHLEQSNDQISIATLMDRVGRGSHFQNFSSKFPLTFAHFFMFSLENDTNAENLMSNIGRHTTMSVPLSQVAAKDFLMDPNDPVVLVKTVVKPMLGTAVESESESEGAAVAEDGVAGGERLGSVAQEFKLVDPRVCRAIGGAVALFVVAAGAASSLG